MSETAIYTIILVFASGYVGFGVGALLGKLWPSASPVPATAPARTAEPVRPAVAPASEQRPEPAPEPARQAAAAVPTQAAAPPVQAAASAPQPARGAAPTVPPKTPEPSKQPDQAAEIPVMTRGPAAHLSSDAKPAEATTRRPAKAPAAAEAGAPKPRKPRFLKQARKSGADDLKRIKGVGPKLEATLNELGVYHYDQIAKWTADHIAWVDEHLKFRGRIDRDGWIDQASTLAAGGKAKSEAKSDAESEA